MSAGLPTETTEDTPQDDNTPKINLKTAFVIAIDEDGNVYVERDPKALSVPVERAASLLEVRRYTQEIISDLQAQAAAEYVAIRLGAAQPPAAN